MEGLRFGESNITSRVGSVAYKMHGQARLSFCGEELALVVRARNVSILVASFKDDLLMLQISHYTGTSNAGPYCENFRHDI